MGYLIPFLVLSLALVAHAATEENGEQKGPKGIEDIGDLVNLMNVLDKRYAATKDLTAVQSALNENKKELTDVKLKMIGNIKTNCSTRYTAWQYGAHEALQNLDRHTIWCYSNNNEVLSHLHVETSGSNIRYEYTCCSLHL